MQKVKEVVLKYFDQLLKMSICDHHKVVFGNFASLKKRERVLNRP